MRLLLDTPIFPWAVAGSSKLKASSRRLIESADEVHVSAASIWEIAIKSRLGKIDADADELVAAIAASGFVELPVRSVHQCGRHPRPIHRPRFRSDIHIHLLPCRPPKHR